MSNNFRTLTRDHRTPKVIIKKRSKPLVRISPSTLLSSSQKEALLGLLYQFGTYAPTVRNIKPPYHVTEPTLKSIIKRAWSRFKNLLLRKLG